MATLDVAIPENSQNIEGVATIKAPLEKVFHAYVDKDLFQKWFGYGKSTIHAFDAKSGGAWHLSEKGPDGNEYEFCGSYHEVAENERIVWTFEFLGMPERGHVVLEVMTFHKIDEATTEIRSLSTYQSVTDRQGMIESGMEEGWRHTTEALEKLVGEK